MPTNPTAVDDAVCLEPCMRSVDIEESRRTARQHHGRVATIKVAGGMPPRYVLVANTSAEGVRLQLNGIDFLDEFVLLLHDNGGEARDGTYKLIWRHGQDAGAKFISDETQIG